MANLFLWVQSSSHQKPLPRDKMYRYAGHPLHLWGGVGSW